METKKIIKYLFISATLIISSYLLAHPKIEIVGKAYQRTNWEQKVVWDNQPIEIRKT